VNVGNKRLEFKAPKTRAGRRAVQLPSILVDALRAERDRQYEVRSFLGPTYNSTDLVVCKDDGTYAHPATLYSMFQDLLIRLKMPRMALHDLRHSHATHLLESGVNPKVVGGSGLDIPIPL